MADVITEGMVRAVLAELPGIDVDDIEVDVLGTRVVLSGQVSTEHEREAIESAVQSIYGVEDIENRLVVTGEPI